MIGTARLRERRARHGRDARPGRRRARGGRAGVPRRMGTARPRDGHRLADPRQHRRGPPPARTDPRPRIPAHDLLRALVRGAPRDAGSGRRGDTGRARQRPRRSQRAEGDAAPFARGGRTRALASRFVRARPGPASPSSPATASGRAISTPPATPACHAMSAATPVSSSAATAPTCSPTATPTALARIRARSTPCASPRGSSGARAGPSATASASIYGSLILSAF